MCSAGISFRTFGFNLVLIFTPVWLFCQTKAHEEHTGNPQNEVLFPGNSERPRFTVANLTNLCLGAFYPGKYGGTVEINNNGVRSASGSAILMSSDLNPSPAVFEIRCPGNTMVNIMIEEEIELRNQNGGVLICNPIGNGQSNFVSPQNAQAGFLYSVGARINTMNASNEPSGEYSGTFNITIVFE